MQSARAGLGAWVQATFDRLAQLRPGVPKSDPHLHSVRVMAEESARLSDELRFKLLVESVSEYAIFMVDPQGYVTTWNVGAQRIKGYEARDIIGRHFSLFYELADVQAGKCEQELELAVRDGRYEDEGFRVRKDGSRFWANVVVTALRTVSGELVGYAMVTRDLTERRIAEQERVRLARAEEAVRLRDEFLAIASHELRTPLTALQLQLQSIHERSGSMDLSLARKVERATRSTLRMTNLVESLLDATQLTSSPLSLSLSSFDLREMVSHLVDDLRIAARRADTKLELVAATELLGRWDRVRIEQVLTNLISNAVKYGDGQSITIELRSGGANQAVIEVKDGGPGISEPDLARIFGRFERSVSLRHHGGLGLGLYVARAIVHAHGGSIRAHNNPEGGACFRVELPRDPLTEQAVLPFLSSEGLARR